MKFCRFCGSEMKDRNICECEQSKLHRSTKKKMIIVAVVAFAAILLIVLLLLIRASKDHQTDPGTNPNNNPSAHPNNGLTGGTITVNPFDYTEVSFEGFNSYGRVLINYDIDSMIEDLIGECPSEDDFESFSRWLGQYLSYSENIDYDCSKSNNLSNGDTITITFFVSDSASGVKGCSREYTVSGLKSTQEKDIFSNVSITYSGLSGDAYAIINRSQNEEWEKYCNFEISPVSDLSNGDEITVSLSAISIETLKNSYGIIPMETSKTYVVEGLDAYVSSVDQIPADLLRQFADRFIAQVEEESADEGGFSYGETTLYGIYFMTKRPGSWFVETNVLEIVVVTDQYYRDEYLRTIYEPLQFYNITVGPNGELNTSYEDGSHSIFTDDIDSYFSNHKEDYNVYEIAVQ